MPSVLLLVLAAGGAVAPAPAVVPSAPASDPLTALYALVGAQVIIGAIGGIVTFVKWFSSRTVHQADEEKKKSEDRVAALEEFKSEQERATERAVRDVKELAESVSKMTGTVAEISKQVDTRIEKQGAYYLAQLELQKKGQEEALKAAMRDLRQEASRSMADAQQLAKAEFAAQQIAAQQAQALAQQAAQQQQIAQQLSAQNYAPASARRRAKKRATS